MDSHDLKIFEVVGLTNFLRYGALLTCLQCAGAPLKMDQQETEAFFTHWQKGAW